MKLTKKLEEEIRQLMDNFWSSYLEGDLQTWASYLPDNYQNIGTTQEEIWNSKKDIVDYTKRVADHMVGMADLRNKQTQIIPFDPHIMVHELGDLYIKMEDGWTFYAKLRLSSLLEKTGAGWKILHQHGSYPDSKTEEGETFAFDKISRENLELREAVKRRTIEVEQKNRELEIEASLERIRARTMTMQKSEELTDVAALLFKQVTDLGIKTWTTGFNVWSDDNNCYEDYITSPQGGFIQPYVIDASRFPVFKEVSDAKKSGQEFFVQYLEGELLKETYVELSRFGDKKQFEKMLDDGFEFPSRQVDHFVFGPKVSLMFITYEDVPEAHSIFKRFGKVFDQTYTRFLDLQRAEAQAREARIEASLEKVRSRAMAMHSSQELKEVALELRTQMALAEQHELEVCAIHLYDESPDYFESWAAIRPPHLEGKTVQVQEKFPKRGIKIVEEMMQQYQSGKKDYILVNEGEKVPEWLEQLKEKVPEGYEMVIQSLNGGRPEDSCAYWSIADFQGGALVMTTYIPPMEEARHLLRRFANVFELAYRRFVELKQAEAQVREAQIEASLERVRSRAMAMHSSGDLAATIGSFYRELQTFSITPRRCGVGLLDQEERVGELFTWNTTDTGQSLELIGKIRMEGHPVLNQVYEHWLAGTEYHPILRGNEIKEYYQLLRPQIAFPDYPHDTVQYGYFFFFNEGGVYAWAEKEMNEDELQIYRRFTSVLSLTYKRYKDLKQAEAYALQAKEDMVKLQAEKKRAEEAFAELQVTQKQLIQSEKMASLGELTAGIAHEIQNPLNFVNNFSEINKELIEELKSEKSKVKSERNEQLENELLNDIEQNLEKINHHGKRADAIVKGMLQHSRTSSGVKEPTDINALCDEYLRLSYHGLRAKDKSFNATMKTDFDTSIGKINVVPQELGRVILNLLTNAFYAVNEKKKTTLDKASAGNYEPTVSVSTKRGKNKIEIKVKDNGNGIPPKILDKIFQPFFTTKPTGQGTGLGLSLSYDIITKGQGGELKVETNENEGTSFIIIIPF